MPRKVDLLARDVFPGWMRTGPWPYEVGMVTLMGWVIWCLLHGGVIRPAPNSYLSAFATFVSGSYAIHAAVVLVALATMMGMVFGLGALMAGQRSWANKVRGASIMSASLFSFGMAALFISSVDYSLAGGAYAFIGWRAFCVGVRLWWEPDADAQPSG